MSSLTQSTVFTVAELEQHPYFERTKQRKSRWYCTLCSNPELAGVAHFDPRGAAKHENSQRHREQLLRISQAQELTWEDLNGWAGLPPPSWDQAPLPERRRRRKKTKTPFGDLQTAERHMVLECEDAARRKWRIVMWMKSSVLQSGGTWVETEADIEPPIPGPIWDTSGEDLPPERTWGLPVPGGEDETDTGNTEDIPVAESEIRPPEGHHVDIDVGTSYSQKLDEEDEKLMRYFHASRPQKPTYNPSKLQPHRR
ncbi:hypothetical protein AURDEDRAFT_111003 [Auricularia subglabra TFB-10046 SS5]|nr:hypothetical protein AURDEDRAFT_111003 [Auricularia subglabra TFB-10046 SS5]